MRKEVHQFLFDYVDKKKSKFRNIALRVLKTGDEPFRSEAFLRVGKDFLNKKKIGSARSQFFKILKSKQALNESKAKAAVLIAEMDVETLKLTLPSGPMSAHRTVRYIERMMLRAQPNIDQMQAVFKFNNPESSLRALIKLSRLYVDLGIVFESIQVSDKAHLKRSTEREVRTFLTKIRDSYYKSYSSALNIMSRNKKLKRKYSSRLKRIKRDFKKFVTGHPLDEMQGANDERTEAYKRYVGVKRQRSPRSRSPRGDQLYIFYKTQRIAMKGSR